MVAETRRRMPHILPSSKNTSWPRGNPHTDVTTRLQAHHIHDLFPSLPTSPPSSHYPAPPPLPLHPLFCLPINLDFVRIHLSRPLSPPPSYSTSWGTSPSCPPCLLGGSSKVSPPLRIDSLAALKKQEGWSLHTNSIPINVG